MKRNTVIIVVAVVAAAFFFLDPIGLFKKPNPYIIRPKSDATAVSGLLSYAESHWTPPADYVAKAFANRDVIFLGDLVKTAEIPKFVASLIPALHAAGVRSLGLEYALSEDQDKIDALLSAPAYDEAGARRITMDFNVTWGYQEYIDIYKAAWEFNRTPAAREKPFRIVGLNVRYLYEFIQTEADRTNAETIRKVMANGDTESHMAEIIRREFTDKKEKALVYCGMQRASTRFKDTQYAKNAADMKIPETRRTAEIVAERIGTRAGTVLIHTPWLDSKSVISLSYPVGGVLDALLEALPPDKGMGGFDVVGTPFGSLEVKSGWWAADHPGMTLSGICDGYVFLGPISGLHAGTPISGFIPAGDAEYAIKNFPEPKPKNLTLEMLNKVITDEATYFEQMLRSMK
jgi:hypothetical protein